MCRKKNIAWGSKNFYKEASGVISKLDKGGVQMSLIMYQTINPKLLKVLAESLVVHLKEERLIPELKYCYTAPYSFLRERILRKKLKGLGSYDNL